MRIHSLMTILVVGVSLNMAAAESPDDHPYFPLEVGNYWIYQFSDGGGEGYITWEVVGDTTLASEFYWLLNIVESEFGSDNSREELCAVRITAGPDETIEFVSLAGDVGLCTLDGVVSEVAISTSGPPFSRDYWISGQQYSLDTIGAVYGIGPVKWLVFANDVGLLKSYGPASFPRRHLVYAVTGGNEFGMHPDDFDWTILSPRNVGDTWLWHGYRTTGWGDEEYLIRTGIIEIVESDENSISYAVNYERLTMNYDVMESRTCLLTRYRWGVDTIQGSFLCHAVSLGRSFGLIGTMDRRDNEEPPIVDKLSVDFGYDDGGDITLVSRWFEGIGLVEYSYRNDAGTGSQIRRFTLLSANVAGVEHGSAADWNPVFKCDLEIYPNPAQKNVTVEVNNIFGGDIRLGIYDMSGRRVRTGEYTGHSPSTVITQDVSGLAAGAYVVNAHTSVNCSGARLIIVD